MDRYSLAVLAALSGGVLVLGCASDPSPPPRGPAPALVSGTEYAGLTFVAPAPPADTATPTSGSIHIDPKIMEACGNLPTPHFAFDSADLQEPSRANLDAIAVCFTTGPLKGRELKLVGYTDPRGTADYNLQLGQRRAGSVADYLTQHGVTKAYLLTLSKGESDAQGTDEAGWALDRKVVIMLVE